MKLQDMHKVGDVEYTRPIFAWLLNTVCQYRCTYCFYQNFLNKKEPAQNKTAYKRILKRLSMNTMPAFEVDIIGGEPTLHENIHEILEELNNNNKCEKLTINTNLARDVKWYQQLDDIKYNKLNITASYHPEYHLKHPEKYINKCIALSTVKNITFICNVNIYEKHWDVTKTTIETLLENNVPVGLNTLDPVDGVWEEEYSDEFRIHLQSYIEHVKRTYNINPMKEELIEFTDYQSNKYMVSDYRIRIDKLDRYKSWECKALYWSIDPDGRVYNLCTGEDLKPLNDNIIDDVICPVAEGCPCQDCFKFPKTNQR